MSSSPPPSIPQEVWVDEEEIRRIFNEMKIEDRANTHDLRVEVARSKPVPKERDIYNWIPGTLSQSVKYFDKDNNLIAKAHRYLRPDGLLAAGGKADPKRVLFEGIYYILDGSKSGTI